MIKDVHHVSVVFIVNPITQTVDYAVLGFENK